MSIFVWRVWTKHYCPTVLFGQYNSPWEPGRMKRAHCSQLSRYYNDNSEWFYRRWPDALLHDGCDIPFHSCTCGIYGMKRDYVPELMYLRDVLGIAEVWGNIIVAERGYRAQYARIRALIDAPEVALDYGVPNLPSIEYARREYFS